MLKKKSVRLVALFLTFIMITSVYTPPPAVLADVITNPSAQSHEYVDLYEALALFISLRLPGTAVLTITEINPTPNIVVIPIAGTNQTWVEFEVIGTLLGNLTPGHFNNHITTGLPWVQVLTGIPLQITDVNTAGTRAVLRVPVRVDENPNLLTSRETDLTVGNSINNVNGSATIRQINVTPEIISITPVPDPVNVEIGTPGSNLTYTVEFDIEGLHFGNPLNPNIGANNFVVSLPPGLGWIVMGIPELTIINDTRATLTVQITVSHNPGASRSTLMSVENDISPAVRRSVAINQPGAQDPIPPHTPGGTPPSGGGVLPPGWDEPVVTPPPPPRDECACMWFDDVSADDWFHDAVTIVAEYGLFHGTGYRTFEPQLPMNRAMFVQVLANLTKAQTAEFYAMRNVFHDSVPGDWYHGAVQWGYHLGHASGVGAWMFAPYDPVTREQAAGFLNRYIRMNNIRLAHIQDRIFTDDADISWWAYDDVDAIQRAGIIGGYPDGSFQPQRASTRAEVASIFAQFLRSAGLVTDM